jgi:ring-1,2-phenylacetyl-CoA epoxidase subunit PaaE
MGLPQFHSLEVKRIEPLTAQSAHITFSVPSELQELFTFEPGQFLTLRAQVGGQSLRRSYSICSAPALLAQRGEISVGIKRVEHGAFSSWATQHVQAGQWLDVMPPDGRFVSKNAQARHVLLIAAGSGITPMLSMLSHRLAHNDSHFTLIYGNQRTSSIMFGEALQDLKDRYPSRLQLIHVLSRQATELALNHGRVDAAKLGDLMPSLIEPAHVDEAFLCGPEALIENATQALQAAGISADKIHSERFASSAQPLIATKSIAIDADSMPGTPLNPSKFDLEVVLDGKSHKMGMGDADTVLDVALDAGLDLPYACKGGVCCTCRAKVIEGSVKMEKNFTLEQWEIDKGFVLTCQAHCLTPRVVVSYDER